jgi:hypothetical protein
MTALATKNPGRKAAHLEATQRAKHAQKQREQQALAELQRQQAAKLAAKKVGKQ